MKPKIGGLWMAMDDKQAYASISGNHRIFVGTFEKGTLGMCLDAGFSSSDVYYNKMLLSNGVVGWVRVEGLKYVREDE